MVSLRVRPHADDRAGRAGEVPDGQGLPRQRVALAVEPLLQLLVVAAARQVVTNQMGARNGFPARKVLRGQ